MIYKLLVNATFLAIGYYIGKEVSRNEFMKKASRQVSEATDRRSETASRPRPDQEPSS